MFEDQRRLHCSLGQIAERNRLLCVCGLVKVPIDLLERLAINGSDQFSERFGSGEHNLGVRFRAIVEPRRIHSVDPMRMTTPRHRKRATVEACRGRCSGSNPDPGVLPVGRGGGSLAGMKFARSTK
jgi:hypothetical protein